MLRHLCLLAAAAAATTTQNATRQLDAYAPAPTDLSRACASWRPDRSDVDRVRTIRAGNFVNLAHATGGAFVASVSKVRRPPKGQNCRVLYRGGDREAEAAGLRRVPGRFVGSVHGRGAGHSFAVVGAPGGLKRVLINFL